MLEPEDEVLDPLDILLDYILEACLTSDVKIAIACDSDVESIVGDEQVVDLASYLRQVQPPVRIDGALGSLCAKDVVSHERKRAFTRRTIIAPDLAKWSGITFENAGRMEDMLVFIPGPTEEESIPLKLQYLVFADSRDTSKTCQCFALSNDGKLLAASFWSSDVLVWRLSDGLLVQRLHHQNHKYQVVSLSFSPSNRTLVSGSLNESTVVWDIRSG
ncbi:uncharacterized protein PHACADRAFT_248983, partial [Phanerochaete carnosa HHB-10118-sp]